MSEDLLKIVGIVALVIFLLYLVSNSLKLHLNLQRTIFEGLENNGENGIGGSAGPYATEISKKATQLHDELLVSKYKSDYENVIMNLDEYLGLAMLQTSLQISPKDPTSPVNMELLTKLNTLHASKQALNSIMTVVEQV